MVLTVLKGLGKAYLKSKAGKKTAVDILETSKKKIQEVMDRGGYSLKDAHTREFLKEQRKKTIKKRILAKGDLVVTEAKESHAIIALKDSEYLVFTQGPRGGKEYENDTFRLEKPLIKYVSERHTVACHLAS